MPYLKDATAKSTSKPSGAYTRLKLVTLYRAWKQAGRPRQGVQSAEHGADDNGGFVGYPLGEEKILKAEAA